MLVFKCGEWQNNLLNDNLKVISQLTETGKQMQDKGYNLTENESVFCNNDNVLNGIILAVFDRKINWKKVVIHFYPNKDDCSFIPLNIDSYGYLEDYPDGFFDQTEKFAYEIIELRDKRDSTNVSI